MNFCQIWKTVKLGCLRSEGDGLEVYRVIKGNGFIITLCAQSVINSQQFEVSEKEQEIELVRIPLSRIGLVNGGSLPTIRRRARSLGLYFCPAEVGLSLCCLPMDLERNSGTIVAMKPVRGKGGYRYVFKVECDSSGQKILNCVDSRHFERNQYFAFYRKVV